MVNLDTYPVVFQGEQNDKCYVPAEMVATLRAQLAESERRRVELVEVVINYLDTSDTLRTRWRRLAWNSPCDHEMLSDANKAARAEVDRLIGGE